MALPSFDPDFATPSDWAAMYRACGLQVVPSKHPREEANWKRPALAEWTTLQESLIPEATFQRWYSRKGEHCRRLNMGVITGRASGNLIVIDLDTHKNDRARQWWQGVLTENNFGIEPETCRQVTGGGGRQVLFRVPEWWHAPTNKTTLGVDVRGQGGFAVIPPSIHASGNSYAWEAGYGPWECEIAIASDWLLAAIDALVDEFSGDTQGKPTENTPSPKSEFDTFGRQIDGRESYMADLVWAAVVGWRLERNEAPTPAESQERMLDAFGQYERNVKSRLDGPGSDADKLEREGRGFSVFAAKWRRAIRQWDGRVTIHMEERRTKAPRSVSEEPLETPADGNGLKPTIPLVGAFPIDPKAIALRDWVIPGLLLRRYLSVLVAPPGSGKSLLTLQLAIAIAVGMDWSGWRMRMPSKTLIVNAEDDISEMHRRLWAAATRMKVAQADLVDKLFLAEAPESIVIARVDTRSRTVVRTPLVEELVNTILAHGISVVVVDPFAETFEGDENSNSEVKWAGILWREVARRTGAAVFLVHHTRKFAGDMAGNADASRGGGALIGTARIVATLFAMTEDEASALNVPPDQRTHYVRFDDAKANMSLVTGVARWFQKETITIPNGTLALPGDEVGVLVPWKPPGAFDGVSMTTIGLILDTIDRGLLDDSGAPTGEFFTAATTRTDRSRWAGTIITRLLGCDDEHAKTILKEWTKNGVIEAFDYVSNNRHERKGLRSVPKNRPDRGQQ